MGDGDRRRIIIRDDDGKPQPHPPFFERRKKIAPWWIFHSVFSVAAPEVNKYSSDRDKAVAVFFFF